MNTQFELRSGRVTNVLCIENQASDTTLFCIHGLGGRGHQWREQISALKNKFSLVIPDLYGLGDSEKSLSADAYSFEELNQDLLALFDRFANKKNVIVGHSYGGALAVSLTLAKEAQVEKLILINPVLCQPNFKLPWFFLLPAFMMEWLRPYLEKVFNQLAYDKTASKELKEEETLAARNNPMYVIKAMASGMKKIPKLDVKKISVPVLLIIGETDNLIMPKAMENFYKQIPRHQIEVIKTAGHMLPLEKPAEVNQRIEGFLSSSSFR